MEQSHPNIVRSIFGKVHAAFSQISTVQKANQESCFYFCWLVKNLHSSLNTQIETVLMTSHQPWQLRAHKNSKDCWTPPAPTLCLAHAKFCIVDLIPCLLKSVGVYPLTLIGIGLDPTSPDPGRRTADQQARGAQDPEAFLLLLSYLLC